MPSFMQALIMIEPINAQLRSALPSTTRTSPGLAIVIAAWIIRLSPGRTSIVNAAPAMRAAGETGMMRPSSVPRRDDDSQAWRRGKRGSLPHDRRRHALEVAADIG